MTPLVYGALPAALARLNTYLAECWLRREDLDQLKLKRLEDDVVLTARISGTVAGGAPF